MSSSPKHIHTHSHPSKLVAESNKALGFTLVEVLLTLWIMSMMALMSWQSIDAMIKVREQSLSSVADLSVVQTALAQWQTDLDNAVHADDQNQMPGIDWDGQTLKMVRTSSAPWDAQGDPGLWVVAWTARTLSNEDLADKGATSYAPGNYWIRWQSPNFKTLSALNLNWQTAASWGKNATQETKARETLLFPIQNWQIFYYRLNAWTNALSSADLMSTPSSVTPSNTSPSLNSISSAASSSAVTSAQANAMNAPDGIRLKLLPGVQTRLGRLASNAEGQSMQASDPTLTMDWVRPNFSNVR
jgi:general secretion pathway protein J